MGRSTRERGTISIFTVMFTLVVFLLAGLVVDGGLAIHARQRAFDISEQAARAGANDIDQDVLRRTGRVVVKDGRAACGLVRHYLSAYGEQILDSRPGDCRPYPDRVEVTVRIRVRSLLLGLINVNAFTMTGTASAHPDEGD